MHIMVCDWVPGSRFRNVKLRAGLGCYTCKEVRQAGLGGADLDTHANEVRPSCRDL